MTNLFLKSAFVLLVLTSNAYAQIEGAGASFPSVIYKKWSKIYSEQSDHEVNYKSTSSSDGVKQITARAIDFGGTDLPLSPQDLSQQKLIQLPMVVGGIVPVLNISGIKNNQMVLTGELLADIMSGEITNWNDRRIAELNPQLNLPNRAIIRIVRAEKSGTTQGYTQYLAEVSDSFKKSTGASAEPNWIGNVIKATGNDGIAEMLKTREGSISYLSYDRVLKENMTAIRLKNAAKQTVTASENSFRAAINGSDMAKKGNDQASLINQKALDAWPITMTSFILVDQFPDNSVRASKTVNFLYWCFMQGDKLTHDSGFAPLPVRMQAQLVARFASIKAKDGIALKYGAF